jgi:hypothetical protein
MPLDDANVNWRYTQLFPNRAAYTLTNPSQYINNHRKKGFKEKLEPQVNLDYLDMIEIEAHGKSLIDDHIVLGLEYSGTITLEGRYRKEIYLKKKDHFEVVIEEFLKRLPKISQIRIEDNEELIKEFNGINSGEARWHSATELYQHFSKNTLRSLLSKLSYEEEDLKSLKVKARQSSFDNRFIDNLHFRLIQQKPGYYEFSDEYPKLRKIDKYYLEMRLGEKVKNSARIQDQSWGIYRVTEDKKLFAVMQLE